MAVLSITASAVLATSTAPLQYLPAAAGVTITQGQALYKLTNNTLGLADANGTTPANSFEGIALVGASPGQPVVYVKADGTFTPGATLTSGGTVWLDSTTPGAMTQTFSDVASGSTVINIGIAISTTQMNLSPVVGGVK